MFSEIRSNRGSQKYASYFTWQVENKLFKASVLWLNNSRIHQDMKIARNDSVVKLGYSDWCGFPLNASERLSELLFFHSKGSRFSSWGLFHCDDRRSLWWASRDRPQHDRSRSDTVMISMNFNSYARLYFSSFLFFLVCFWNRNFIYYTSVSCVWFLLPYVNLQSNWAWKPLKLGLSILFYHWGFLSLLT